MHQKTARSAAIRSSKTHTTSVCDHWLNRKVFFTQMREWQSIGSLHLIEVTATCFRLTGHDYVKFTFSHVTKGFIDFLLEIHNDRRLATSCGIAWCRFYPFWSFSLASASAELAAREFPFKQVTSVARSATDMCKSANSSFALVTADCKRHISSFRWIRHCWQIEADRMWL